jgi:hypothetical protein
MPIMTVCLAVATLGIDVGWQPMPEGGTQYIIQLSPQELDLLRRGGELGSDIPPKAGDVRAYQIVVGTKSLPRQAATVAPKPPEVKLHEEPLASRLAPPTLKPDVTARSIAEKPTAFFGQETPLAKQPSPAAEPTSPSPGKPWLPLIVTLFALFASLGGNVFLGWIAWDSRQRCRTQCSAAV